MLTNLLSQPRIEPEAIHGAMQDRLHQQYRAGLVPGLSEIVGTIKPSSHPGVLGVCLSGNHILGARQDYESANYV